MKKLYNLEAKLPHCEQSALGMHSLFAKTCLLKNLGSLRQQNFAKKYISMIM